MLGFWLDQPIWLMFLILAGGFFGVVAAIQVASYHPRSRPRVMLLAGVVPTFFGSVSVLLALLTGFVANDTWDRERQADRLVRSEADNVLAVFDLSVAAASDMSDIRRVLERYVENVVSDEWPLMASGGASEKAGNSLGALLAEAAKPQIAAQAGAPTQSALLDSVLKIRSERDERLSLNVSRVDDSKWLAILILGVLTQLAIGVVHLDNRRAQLAALVIFTTGLVSTLGLIAIHESPFDGPNAVRPTALEAARDVIAMSLEVRSPH